MTDRPILFSAPMVRALLDGRKTQTRRLLKPQPYSAESVISYDRSSGKWMSCEPSPVTGGTRQMDPRRQIRVRIGDRLWVRESFLPDPPSDDPSWDNNVCTYFEWAGCGSRISDVPPALREPSFCIYAADPKWGVGHGIDWRPSIHMPRWASRLTLIVTDVRVERLQSISEADAFAEGVWHGNTFNRFADDLAASCQDGRWFTGATDWYRDLWDRINGAGAWADNPWVAGYTFTVHRGNIDEVSQ